MLTSPERWSVLLVRASMLLAGFSLLAALVSLAVPVGLPHEGDALNYRVPILKWMLRHAAYPNWNWTYVDDYPLLGDIIMLPFLAVHENLARVVPIFFYLLTGFFGAKIAVSFLPAAMENQKNTAFWFCFSNLLALHPLLLQSNVLMVDNLAAALALGSLYFCLRGRVAISSGLMTVAIASRYSIWGCYPGILLANLRLRMAEGGGRKLSTSFLVLALAGFGALPFMLRNLLLNQNPFYPLFSDWINGQSTYDFSSWGRGSGLGDLLLFPFDLLYTNSFVKTIFDSKIHHFDYYVYTVGKLFYLQLAALLMAIAWKAESRMRPFEGLLRRPDFQSVLLFSGCYFFYWWFGSQQMRFLTILLVLANAFVLVYLVVRLPKAFSLFLMAAAAASVIYVHREPWRIAAGLSLPFRDQPFVRKATDCLAKVKLRKGETVGHNQADALLGFGDYDFVFVPPHAYYVEPRKGPAPAPEYLYDSLWIGKIEGFQPWPEGAPCMFKKAQLGQ